MPVPSNVPNALRGRTTHHGMNWCVNRESSTNVEFMHDFRRLHVWQLSRELAVSLDAVSRRFPKSDRGVVAGQLRRAALSIPSNIAEGCGKSSRKETLRFLQIASGSAHETENHLVIAADLGYISTSVLTELGGQLTSVQRMLAGLMRRIPG